MLYISSLFVLSLSLSPPSRENPLVHLNYAVALYNHGEKRTAAKQFQMFEKKSAKHKPVNPDPEVYTRTSSHTHTHTKHTVTTLLCTVYDVMDQVAVYDVMDQVAAVAARLGAVLHVGEDLTVQGGEEGEEGGRDRGRGGERRRRGGDVMWEDDYQEPDDVILFRERKLSSWF